MDKIVLDCQKCGGSLEVTADTELFKCQFCGTPYMVKREGGITRIVKLEERVDRLGGAVGALVEMPKVRDKQTELEKEAKDWRSNPIYAGIWIVGLIIVMAVTWESNRAVAIIALIILLSIIIAWPLVLLNQKRRREELKAQMDELEQRARDGIS